MAAIVAPIADSIALAFEKTAKTPRSFLCLRVFRKETSPNRCLDKLLETRDERGIRKGFFGSIRPVFAKNGSLSPSACETENFVFGTQIGVFPFLSVLGVIGQKVCPFDRRFSR